MCVIVLRTRFGLYPEQAAERGTVARSRKSRKVEKSTSRTPRKRQVAEQNSITTPRVAGLQHRIQRRFRAHSPQLGQLLNQRLRARSIGFSRSRFVRGNLAECTEVLFDPVRVPVKSCVKKRAPPNLRNGTVGEKSNSPIGPYWALLENSKI